MNRISRLRRSATARAMLAETELVPAQLVLPLFVSHFDDMHREIKTLPGQFQLGNSQLNEVVGQAWDTGVRSVLLFGIPSSKDESGSMAWSSDGPVPRAIRTIKSNNPDVLVIADVCLCEYTSHGHCGVLDTRHQIDTANTLPLLARTAVAYAEAGADVIAPSAMVDGQVAAVRDALDKAGYRDTSILSYSSKFASAFYGPFRDAVSTTLSFGDRSAHQLPVANAREALRESAQDEVEGADMLMVKPAGVYLDILVRLRDRTDLPLVAYQVSGEYAMIKAAVQHGWLDEQRAVLESLIAIRRAGADLVISYFAVSAARWLNEQRRVSHRGSS